jgi:hypothetical protein
MVQMMPADIPERRRARAKIVPAAGAIEVDNRSWMLKRDALSALAKAGEDPATMRMAEFTKRAKVKRDKASSNTEYLRQNFMAARDGWYNGFSDESDESNCSCDGTTTWPFLISYSSRRGWTMPEPR